MQEKRLSKALAAAGIASRRAAEKLIFEGKVTVNGTVTLLPQTLVNWEIDLICVDGQKVSAEEEKIIYVLNKPKGYICSNKREGNKKLVIDLFPEEKRLFTVGRLDRDTTGLIIVTNDGLFSQDVIHPSKNISKEYLVKTKQEISHEDLVKIANGTTVERTWVKPSHVKKMRRGTLKVVVKEGKKREVRYLVQNAGLDILSLTRIRIGNLLLGSLKEGEWRKMTSQEKASLLKRPPSNIRA